MFHKGFYVQFDLQLHAVTCPGVWLCTRGCAEVTVKALGYYFRTGAMEPQFPLLCHDRFIMDGYFKSVGSLEELERVLAAEKVEITLWQSGRRLAYFIGKLSDVMHPCVPKLSCQHNINVQLLMKATPAFPGIIAPKVELTAHMSVQDQFDGKNGKYAHANSHNDDSICSRKYCNSHFLIPHSERTRNRHSQQQLTASLSSCANYLEKPRRQKAVCHTKAPCGNGINVFCHTSAPSCLPNVSDIREAKFISHKNQQRRLSTSSSHLSSISNQLSQSTYNNSCGSCTHTNCSISTADDHQQSCEICQSYRKTFL